MLFQKIGDIYIDEDLKSKDDFFEKIEQESETMNNGNSEPTQNHINRSVSNNEQQEDASDTDSLVNDSLKILDQLNESLDSIAKDDDEGDEEEEEEKAVEEAEEQLAKECAEVAFESVDKQEDKGRVSKKSHFEMSVVL